MYCVYNLYRSYRRNNGSHCWWFIIIACDCIISAVQKLEVWTGARQSIVEGRLQGNTIAWKWSRKQLSKANTSKHTIHIHNISTQQKHISRTKNLIHQKSKAHNFKIRKSWIANAMHTYGSNRGQQWCQQQQQQQQRRRQQQQELKWNRNSCVQTVTKGIFTILKLW